MKEDTGILTILLAFELNHIDFSIGHNATMSSRVVNKPNSVVKVAMTWVVTCRLRDELAIVSEQQTERRGIDVTIVECIAQPAKRQVDTRNSSNTVA